MYVRKSKELSTVTLNRIAVRAPCAPSTPLTLHARLNNHTRHMRTKKRRRNETYEVVHRHGHPLASFNCIHSQVYDIRRSAAGV